MVESVCNPWENSFNLDGLACLSPCGEPIVCLFAVYAWFVHSGVKVMWYVWSFDDDFYMHTMNWQLYNWICGLRTFLNCRDDTKTTKKIGNQLCWRFCRRRMCCKAPQILPCGRVSWRFHRRRSAQAKPTVLSSVYLTPSNVRWAV